MAPKEDNVVALKVLLRPDVRIVGNGRELQPKWWSRSVQPGTQSFNCSVYINPTICVDTNNIYLG